MFTIIREIYKSYIAIECLADSLLMGRLGGKRWCFHIAWSAPLYFVVFKYVENCSSGEIIRWKSIQPIEMYENMRSVTFWKYNFGVMHTGHCGKTFLCRLCTVVNKSITFIWLTLHSNGGTWAHLCRHTIAKFIGKFTLRKVIYTKYRFYCCCLVRVIRAIVGIAE